MALVTHDLQGDPFWAPFLAGARDGARCTDVHVEHVRPATYSVAAMRDALARALASTPSALLTTLPDADALDAPLRAAAADGLPIMLLNTLDKRPPDRRLPVLCGIGADDRAGGRMAAERVLAAAACRHALCIDHYRVRNTCHAERIDGFREVFEAAGGEVTVIDLDATDARSAQARIMDALHGSGRPIDCMLTVGPPGWRHAEAALARTSRVPHVVRVSFDVTDEVLDAIGRMSALGTIDSQQYLQGYLGVTLIDRYLTHGVIPIADVLTGPQWVHSGNLNAAYKRLRAFEV
jgi:simple sugar transport system substrate-binding protein